MEEKLNLILKVLALRLRLDYGFTNPLVENLVNEIDEEVDSSELTHRLAPLNEETDIMTQADFEKWQRNLKSEPYPTEQPKPKRGRPCKPK